MTASTPTARANARARNRARGAALRQLAAEHPDAARITRDWLDITQPELPTDTRRQRALEWVWPGSTPTGCGTCSPSTSRRPGAPDPAPPFVACRHERAPWSP